MAASIVDSNGKKVEDLTTWPTRAEVAEELGVSVPTVRRLERRGILHPVVDAEGTHRFEPREVADLRAIAEREGKPVTTAAALALAGVKHQAASQPLLGASKPAADGLPEIPLAPRMAPTGDERLDVVGYALEMVERMLAYPRELLDRKMFALIEQQASTIRQLSEVQESYWRRLRDVSAEDVERRTAATILERESAVKAEAISKAANTVERWLGGSGRGGIDPKTWPDQKLAELAMLDVWSPDEGRAIAAELHRRRGPAKTGPSSPSSPSSPTVPSSPPPSSNGASSADSASSANGAAA